MRIGHTRLKHNFLFTKTDPPLCQCGDRLTVRHLMSCRLHDQVRSSLQPPPSLDDSAEGANSLFLYLKRLNLYHMIYIVNRKAARTTLPKAPN
ncbi:hypothetical protein M8J77_005133 [Diaphorina citri]|nr:hypothetical protein M8J77_005133 [Diaphorina citri]